MTSRHLLYFLSPQSSPLAFLPTLLFPFLFFSFLPLCLIPTDVRLTSEQLHISLVQGEDLQRPGTNQHRLEKRIRPPCLVTFHTP